MIDALGRDGRAGLGLCQNEGALQNRLGMQRKALSGPGDAEPIPLHCLGDVRFNLGGVPTDARLARRTDVGVGAIGLLHHSSDQTGELGDFAFKDCFSEIEVAEDTIERISVLVVGRRLEKGRRDRTIDPERPNSLPLKDSIP